MLFNDRNKALYVKGAEKTFAIYTCVRGRSCMSVFATLFHYFWNRSKDFFSVDSQLYLEHKSCLKGTKHRLGYLVNNELFRNDDIICWLRLFRGRSCLQAGKIASFHLVFDYFSLHFAENMAFQEVGLHVLDVSR